jgi:phosphoribosylformylglycinamidine synthase
LHNLGFAGVGDVRVGKVIELELGDMAPEAARDAAQAMAEKLLANPVMESFKVDLAG